MINLGDKLPRINNEYISSRQSNNRENYDDPLRELIIRYGASFEDVKKLIGKSENETSNNIEDYKKTHEMLVLPIIDNSETRKLYNAKYGYSRIDGKLVKNEDEQQVIKIIMTLLERGYSYSKMARYLNSNNIESRTSKNWYAGTIHRIVIRENNERNE